MRRSRCRGLDIRQPGIHSPETPDARHPSVRAPWQPWSMAVPRWLAHEEAVCHIDHRDASSGIPGGWPDWLPEASRRRLADRGIVQPWAHQRQAADLAWAGHHLAITTPTASGKTLGYLMPVLAATAYDVAPPVRESIHDARHLLGLQKPTALYLAPTKALEHDQYRVTRELGPQGWLVATLDGDSDQAERRFAREQGRFVLTNPDMLHRTVLPNHGRWARLLRGLSFIVVDEAHRYRGVFGAQVAQVLRRLRRLCGLYGADPVVILASATTSRAQEWGAQLIGEAEPLRIVDQDASPHAARDVLLWQPQDSVSHDAATLMARLVDDHRQVITFVPSRTQAELVALRAQHEATSGARITSYRAGYLAEDRRRLEGGLRSGAIAGVAATNALELGIDVSGVDAVLVAGYPGRLSALWQQIGRAGRGQKDALAVLLSRDDPLDAYLFHHPNLLFDSPVEANVLYPDNPYVLGPQLAAAAQEIPLVLDDRRWFGDLLEPLSDQLTKAGLLRRRVGGRSDPSSQTWPTWYWTRPDRAVDSIDLRDMGGAPLDIVERASGYVIGEVDRAAADRTVYPGAIYLHHGEQYLVQEYLPHDLHAIVSAVQVGYYTQPLISSQISIRRQDSSRRVGRMNVHVGEVLLTNQVTGYLRRDELTNDVWDESVLDLPEHQLTTRATWWTVPDEVVTELGWSTVRLASAAHGAEHAAIGLLPMFAPCDRWDIGGLSTALHPDTGQCTIIVYDGHPGGAGFAEEGFRHFEAWSTATLDRLTTCPCQEGCPACVVSPKCGNANQLLDKASAAQLLSTVLS